MSEPTTSAQTRDHVWHLATAVRPGPVVDTVCGLREVQVLALLRPGGPPYLMGEGCAVCHAEGSKQ